MTGLNDAAAGHAARGGGRTRSRDDDRSPSDFDTTPTAPPIPTQGVPPSQIPAVPPSPIPAVPPMQAVPTHAPSPRRLVAEAVLDLARRPGTALAALPRDWAATRTATAKVGPNQVERPCSPGPKALVAALSSPVGIRALRHGSLRRRLLVRSRPQQQITL
ncbi:MAG: hypothetical protein ACXV5Q_13620 [Frankiaceae bacterium]